MRVIVSFARDYVAYASMWILNIAPSSGYQMHVAMRNSLSRNFTVVDSDVESLHRSVARFHLPPHLDK